MYIITENFQHPIQLNKAPSLLLKLTTLNTQYVYVYKVHMKCLILLMMQT